MGTKLIVAIDGPSGAGKSTLSKALAKHTGYVNIDTGAMYRSVALLANRQQVDVADEHALQRLCDGMTIEFVRDTEQERVIVNGEDVSQQIRTPEVSLLTSKVAAQPVVRDAMVRLQRQMGEVGGVVLEGRDIGTVVFPNADVKFFLSATAEERGRRRYEELKAKGVEVDLQQTIAEVEQRDAADSAREHAPLKRADDAIDIDSTRMGIDEVLDFMLQEISAREKRES
ncbi:cytidylate kinase [Malonomonas rubra DSM 5091]|uniref:Cytidylate kinase n=1 Tax=Malonomonas rubra DSM 5091 TaxID=1122189 RepID=A0A1M6CC34_MALRU|nr:(d)CMP kinase [Malonomonas rubra]SHI58443.1 cytidylate kinase [Malonomonas rubra DSM 5091]